MAPSTRSSRHGPSPLSNTSFGEPQRQPSHSQSIMDTDTPDDRFDEQQEGTENEDDGEPFSPEDDEDEVPAFLSSTSAQEMLLPLQETADRVGRQVEEFAKSLDRFNTARDISDQTFWEDAWALTDQYKAIATSRKEKMPATYGRSRSVSGSRSRSSDLQEEGEKVQFEADLWGLIRHILTCNSPDAIADAQKKQKSGLGELNRYSTPAQIWEMFLNSDITGQEYEGMLLWLQERASTSLQKIEDVVSGLVDKAERGQGFWAAGSLFTKSAIKAQKRSRSWPKPLEPSNPGLQASHVRATDGRPLTTQMDPDAHTREGHVLQPQDEYYEQAAWQACWESLRRGQNQIQSREWWTERKELWRAAIIRGAHPAQQMPANSPWLRTINIASNQEWCKAAAMLCQDGADLDEYQLAVYGLLCGDESSSIKVCKSIDDYLFAILNAQLITRYQQYIQLHQHRLKHFDEVSYVPPPAKWDHVRQYIMFSQNDRKTHAESRQAHRSIEAALLSNDLEEFYVRQGHAVAQLARLTGESTDLFVYDPSIPTNECAQATARDPDSVRMLVHLQLLLKCLGMLEKPYKEKREAMENNITHYIVWLHAEGKQALLPLYASKLSEEKIPYVLGPLLIEIEDDKERHLQIKLMKKYEINIPDVLWGIFQQANRESINRYTLQQVQFTLPRITEHVGTACVKNVKIKPRFMEDEIRQQDEAAILSMEWFKYITAEDWGRACWAAEIFYMTWLAEGRLNAARTLMERASLTGTSMNALGMNLNVIGVLDDAEEDGEVEMDGIPREEQAQPISPSKKRQKLHKLARPGTSREQLASKSFVWSQLERLIYVFDCLEEWTLFAEEVERNRDNTARIRGMKRDLERLLKSVQDAVMPLFEKDFLCKPSNPDQSFYLDKIRNHYLPEIILAWNAVLFFAGHAISRSYLVECMNLAHEVASNETITNAFVESRRMQELVTCLAMDSQALLRANEAGGKKGKKDHGIEIWQVKFKTGELSDLDALD